MSEQIPLMDIKGLEAFLRDHHVPLEKWGKGEARSLEHLAKELAAGEAILTIEEDGRLLRTGFGVAIWVYYVDKQGRRFWLKEECQKYANGNERRRGDLIEMSIGEKRQASESVQEAAERAFREELKLKIPFDRLEVLPPRDKRTPSKAFPGLDTRYATNVFRITLREEEVDPDGYVEVQPDKTTYFKWKLVS